MMYEDLCRPSLAEALLLGVWVPLAWCVKSSIDDLVLSAGVSKTLWLMVG
jgi:hypothetical protein